MRDNVIRNRNRKKRIFFVILTILLCGAIYGGVSIYNTLNKVNEIEIPTKDEDLGIVTQVSEDLSDKSIINIALFGVDSRTVEADGSARSDSIMILSLDKEHNKLKLTSIMRDLYIKVDGHGSTKMNSAYAFGGPTLAIKTINKNFDMNIKDYITVDFFGLEDIIDSLGGIEIDVKENEIHSNSKTYKALINECIKEVAYLENKTPTYVKNPGLQTLNGMQAVGYARIRDAGNSDFDRTARQRLVIERVLAKATKAGITKFPGLLNATLPYVETSLSKTQILSMGSSVLSRGITTLEQFRLPEDKYAQSKMINSVSYLVTDYNIAKKNLYKFIYEEDKKDTSK